MPVFYRVLSLRCNACLAYNVFSSAEQRLPTLFQKLMQRLPLGTTRYRRQTQKRLRARASVRLTKENR